MFAAGAGGAGRNRNEIAVSPQAWKNGKKRENSGMLPLNRWPVMTVIACPINVLMSSAIQIICGSTMPTAQAGASSTDSVHKAIVLSSSARSLK